MFCPFVKSECNKGCKFLDQEECLIHKGIKTIISKTSDTADNTSYNYLKFNEISGKLDEITDLLKKGN